MARKIIFLLVDDDQDDCEFFCEGIKEVEPFAQCDIVSNGEDALLKLRNETNPLPDYIFLDLNMPKMDGKTFLIELKRDERLNNIPVIIYSTSSFQKDIDDTRSLGAIYFIVKPHESHKLHSEIVAAMKEVLLNKTKIPNY